MNKPKVSIILTTYQRPEQLKHAWQSVLDQTLTDWECIVIDDDSKMPAQRAVLREIAGHPQARVFVRLVDESTRFMTVRYAENVNLGLDLARGEYVTYLCDDDYYLPDRLEKMVAFLDANLDKHVVYGSQRVEDLIAGVTRMREAKEPLENADCVVDHSSVLHRRSVVDTVGYWHTTPDLWGRADGEYWSRIGKAGFLFYPIPDVLDVHVTHTGSWTQGEGTQKIQAAFDKERIN